MGRLDGVFFIYFRRETNSSRLSDVKVYLMALKNCNSCGRQTKEYSEFPCPSCGEARIVRCQHCRETLNIYKCPKCGREGP